MLALNHPMASSCLPLLFIIILSVYVIPFRHVSSMTVNPFTSAATTVRYWNRKIPNNTNHPDFFLSLLSPLPASLSSSLPSPLSISPSFCRSARILCPNSTFIQLLSSPSSGNNPTSSPTYIKYNSHISSEPLSSTGSPTYIKYNSHTSSEPLSSTGSPTYIKYNSHTSSEPLSSTGSPTYIKYNSHTSYEPLSSTGSPTYIKYNSHTSSEPLSSTGSPTYIKYNSHTSSEPLSSTGSPTYIKYNSHTSYEPLSSTGSPTYIKYNSHTSSEPLSSTGSPTYIKYNSHTSSEPLSSTGSPTYIKYNSHTSSEPLSSTGSPTYIKYNSHTSSDPLSSTAMRESSSAFEPGTFFRESELKEENVMPMPDITDKMHARSFLPRSIVDRIPFEADDVKSMFRLAPNTTLAKIVDKTVADCQMSPSQGETIRCTTSAEDMIDFAVEMLGDDIVVRSTESPNGSGGLIKIGKVNRINGGKVTRSVSCHQRLFPYMVHHCHSVPKVRVYEVEILSIGTKKKINRAFAVCHLDTSAWSAGNLAFLILGGKPGNIEVCHWIFNGDLVWVVADHDPNQYIRSY